MKKNNSENIMSLKPLVRIHYALQSVAYQSSVTINCHFFIYNEWINLFSVPLFGSTF